MSQTRPTGFNAYPSPGRRLGTETYVKSTSGTCTNHVCQTECYAAAQSVSLYSSQGGLDAAYTASEPPGCYRKEADGMVRFNLMASSTVQHGTNFKGVCCASGCVPCGGTAASTESPTASPTESPAAPLNWVLLFRQTAPTLMTQAEARRINPDNSANDNYSILDTLEGFRESDGKFTLKLVWPGHAGTNSQSWRQTSNPVFATSRGVVGYEVRCCRVLSRTQAP